MVLLVRRSDCSPYYEDKTPKNREKVFENSTVERTETDLNGMKRSVEVESEFASDAKVLENRIRAAMSETPTRETE